MIRPSFSAPRRPTGTLVSVVLALGFVYDCGGAKRICVAQTSAPRPVPRALDDAVSDACREIPSRLPEPESVLKPLLLLPLGGDREGIVTNRLRESLDRQGWYRPVEANLLDKVFATARELTGIGSDPSDRSMQWTSAELAGMMRSAKAEAVLRGSVDRLAAPENGPVEIELRLELWELSASSPDTAVLRHSLDVVRPAPGMRVPPGANRWAAFFRTYGIVMLIALVWPFAMIPWMKKAIRKDRNAAVLKALLGMTAIPLPALIVYLSCLGNGGLAIALQVGIGGLFLFLYTAFVLDRMQGFRQ